MSLKLLFADDSVTMHKVIQLALESEDIDLRIANDGREALSAIGEEKPDVLIADITMPIMNGFELCRQIKQSAETKDIPVVLLSGELEEYDEKLGTTVGADAHITKPFKSGEFIDTVRHLTVGGVAAEKSGVQPEIGLVAENDLEIEAGTAYEEMATDAAAGSEQDALLELTSEQSADSEKAAVTDEEGDEELEVISDDIEIEDALDDEDEEDILSEGLDIDGVDMDLDGLEEIAEEGAEEPPVTGAVREAGTFLANDQLVDDDLDAAFKDISGGAETCTETALPADEPEKAEEAAESVVETDDEAVKHAGVMEAEADKADEILDEVFKNTDIESSDEQLEEVAEAVDEEEFVYDATEAEAVEVVTGQVVAEVPVAESAEAGSEQTPVPMAEADAGIEVPEVSPIDVGDAVRDSVEKSLREFMEAEAADIFREQISKSLDERLNSFMESQLETIVKEEMSSAIGKRIESAMPEIVSAAARITSEIAPKIAEELISRAIEQIKKGDAGD